MNRLKLSLPFLIQEKLDHHLHLRISQFELKLAKDLAKKHKVTLSLLIRHLIQAFYEEDK